MNVLCVMAHPDDETLGCGGTLALHAAAGDIVSVMTFTDGVSSRQNVDPGAADVRHEEFVKALTQLGVSPQGVRTGGGTETFSWQQDSKGRGWWCDRYVDQSLDQAPMTALTEYVMGVLRRTMPDVVYTHWPGDLNGDHRRVAEAVLVATRPVTGSSVARVLACEIPESLQGFGAFGSFTPNVFVKLDDRAVVMKSKAVGCYESEVRKYPHPRSISAIECRAAAYGGLAGVTWAEAFVLLREVV